MSLPFFKEIILDYANQEMINKSLLEAKVGATPLLIKFGNRLSLDNCIRATRFLEKALTKFNINPHFPYPIYLITKHDIGPSFFTQIKDESRIPHFFRNKSQVLTPKEKAILKKLDIQNTKLKNMDFNNSLQSLKEMAFQQKILFHLGLEIEFYQSLYIKLKERQDLNET